MKLVNTVVLSEKQAERRAPAREPESGLAPGTQLDRYLIVEQLGGGGMGLVYRALDTELNRDVALKVLPRARCQAEPLARFRAEAQAQARLRSPHIVTLYSLLELPVGALLVLEYVEGQTLEARLRKHGPLPPEQAIAVFEQVLRGVEHMHEMGVVHRDLKPANLFVTASGQLKIMDFSIAKLHDQDVYPPGTMIGTLLYIPPEQIGGRATDVRSDVYTLGISLYEAVTGRVPFNCQTDYALMHAHVQERPPAPRSLVPSLSKDLERVILRAIEKEPGRRYRSAAEFRAALVKLGVKAAGGTDLPANAFGPAPAVSPAKRHSPRVMASFALDLLLVAMLAALLYALGLYPTGPAPVVQSATVAPPASATARTAATRTDRPAPRSQVPAKPQTKKPSDGYDALRKAWGE